MTNLVNLLLQKFRLQLRLSKARLKMSYRILVIQYKTRKLLKMQETLKKRLQQRQLQS